MELRNNQYHIQGIPITQLAEEFGTPLYIYDEEIISRQIEALKSAFGDLNLHIKYAVKALSNINILKLMKAAGTGLDVVSIQEAELGIQAGFDPKEIIYTSNSVSFEEVKQGVDLGVVINIDNISILEQFGHEYGSSVPICIRINPHILAGGNAKISTGHIDSKFGISILQIRHLLRVVESNNIHVTGIHMHTGSDILDTEVFLKAADILFDVAKNFKDLEFLDFGSGFKVAYRENDVTTDIPRLGRSLTKAFHDFCKSYGRQLELWFEPGKFLVSEAGILLVRTNVIKTTPATVFAGVDSGMNHLIRPAMYDSYHEMINVSNPEGIKRVYTVVGYICETDTLGYDRKLNELHVGDLIAIRNTGAYGFAMASNYNSRFRPAEVLVRDGQALLIRKRENMEDLMRNQVELSN